MVNFHKYSVFGTWKLAKYSCGILTSLLFTKPFGKRLQNRTVLDLIVICVKNGTIKYSNKIDKFSQIAELCEFEVK